MREHVPGAPIPVDVIEWPVDTSARHEWRDIRRAGSDGMIYPAQVCQRCGAMPFEGRMPPCHPFVGDFAAAFIRGLEMELQA